MINLNILIKHIKYRYISRYTNKINKISIYLNNEILVNIRFRYISIYKEVFKKINIDIYLFNTKYR